jgi:RNA polymerase sigma-70 factor (ECF subfamily)
MGPPRSTAPSAPSQQAVGDSAFGNLMERLRHGDGEAALQVFQQFAFRLVALAHSRLSSQLRQKVDAEDVLQSVFRSFFDGHAQGRFRLVSWDSLWGLLADITLRKCAGKAEYFHASRRNVDREVSSAARPDDSASSWQGLSREPTPEEAACLSETVELLLRDLNPRERDIVVLTLQGYSIPEISASIGRTERSVYRILARVRHRLERVRGGPGER